MTSTSVRAGATRRLAATLESDLSLLADQLQRCIGSQGRWPQWRMLTEQVRAFAASHVLSVVVVGSLIASGFWVLS